MPKKRKTKVKESTSIPDIYLIAFPLSPLDIIFYQLDGFDDMADLFELGAKAKIKSIPELNSLPALKKISLAIKYLRERKAKILEIEKQDTQEQESDYDGEEMVFNEDGECIRGSEWDYPGSPYLTDDNDIY